MNGGVNIDLELVNMVVNSEVISRDTATEFSREVIDFVQQVEDALLLIVTDDRVILQDFIELTHVETEQRHFAPELLVLQVNVIVWICHLANLRATEHYSHTQQRD